ncbi:MAG TPA: hypothetical protein DDZ41_03820 [Flavobacterium sp.]|nr:hypothetical protein [Flavobacterium sp.]
MIPYIIIYLLFLIATFNDNKKSSNNWYFFLFIVASIMVGVRDMIGGFDVYIYGDIFEAPTQLLLAYEPMEIGFRYFFAFLKMFNENRHFMFVVMAFIIFYFQFKIYKKLSPLVLLALFIFFSKFFLMSFVYLRQGLAMGIITLAIPFALNKQYIKYFFIIIIAFYLHKSSVLFAPFIFVAHRKFSINQFFIIIGIVIIVAVSPLNNMLFGFLAESTGDVKVAAYVIRNSGVNIFYFIEIILLSIILIQYKNEFYKNSTSQMIANGLFLYILVSLIGITNASFVRFSWYYLPFFVLGISYFISFQKNERSLSLYKTLVIVYFTLLFFRLLLLYDAGDLMPYKTIFENYDRNGLWDHMEYRKK